MDLYYVQLNIFIKMVGNMYHLVVDGPFGRLWYLTKVSQDRNEIVDRMNWFKRQFVDGRFTINMEHWKLHKFLLSPNELASQRQVNYIAKLYGIPRSNKAARADIGMMSKYQANKVIKEANAVVHQ
jgi:hypothetical protein